jgi:MarR family transcriptional regulator, transcriptional regulator for hemolysin
MTLNNTKITSENLLFRLALLTRRWRQVLDVSLQASGLTDATWRPLLHLHLHGDGTRQKDLAESLGIRGPSIVRLLDTLLAKGFIRRTEDVTDRRAKLLFMTPDGQLLVHRIKETVRSLERELLGSFSDSEINQVASFVQCLESKISPIALPEIDNE